jgi:hypothetical protein
MLLLIFL